MLLSVVERLRFFSLNCLPAQGVGNSLHSFREKEMVAFSNMGNTKGGDSDKDLIQADEKCSYLETLLLDFNSKHEDNGASGKAAEPRNADAQHTADFTAKQVTSFPIAKSGVRFYHPPSNN